MMLIFCTVVHWGPYYGLTIKNYNLEEEKTFLGFVKMCLFANMSDSFPRDGLYGGLSPGDLIPQSTTLANVIAVTLPAAASKNQPPHFCRIRIFSPDLNHFCLIRVGLMDLNSTPPLV